MFFRTRADLSAAPSFQVSPRTLWMLRLAQRFDDMLMFYVVTVAVIASIAVLPAYAAIGPIHPEKRVATKSGRLPNGAVERACAGHGWGDESRECLVAILRDSGRATVAIRIVVPSAGLGHTGL